MDLASVGTIGSIGSIGSLDIWRQQVAGGGSARSASLQLGQSWTALGDRTKLVPVDEEDRLLKFLHLSLAGTPRSSGRRPLIVRLWVSSCVLVGMSGAYNLLGAATLMSSAWRGLAYCAALVNVLCYFAIGECTAIMAQTMPQPASSALGQQLTGGSSEIGAGGAAAASKNLVNQQKMQFVETLLGTEVSEACAAEVRGWLTKSYLNVFPCMAILWYIIGTINSDDMTGAAEPLTFDVQVVTVLYCVGCIPLTMILSGWLLYMHVPCVIVRERVEQMASAVKAMNRTKGNARDYDAVMSMVQAAHESTLRLSALVTPTMAVNAGISWCVVALFLIAGWLPRSDDCTSPAAQSGVDEAPPLQRNAHDGCVTVIVRKIPPWVCLCGSVIFYINTLIPLLSGEHKTLSVFLHHFLVHGKRSFV